MKKRHLFFPAEPFVGERLNINGDDILCRDSIHMKAVLFSFVFEIFQCIFKSAWCASKLMCK